MTFKTYKDLVNSPLARRDSSPEEILLWMDIENGGVKNDATLVDDLLKILNLINDNYHSEDDRFFDEAGSYLKYLRNTSFGMYSAAATLFASTIMEIYTSDVILKNFFRILFETGEWDQVLTSSVFVAGVKKLAKTSKSKIHTKSEFITHINQSQLDLFEIWSELEDKIKAKRNGEKT